jgi:hypothetical protein
MEFRAVATGIVSLGALVLCLKPVHGANSTAIYDRYYDYSVDPMQVRLLEYYFETDKTTYALGETVQTVFRLSNGFPWTEQFQLPQQPAYDLEVWHDDTLIWHKNHGSLIFPVFSSLSIEPGEVLELRNSWDLYESSGSFVETGQYTVRSVYRGVRTMSVPITVVPEPGSLSVLLGAMGVALTRNRKMPS